MSKKVFYYNGNPESDLYFEENGALCRFLEDNYEAYFDRVGEKFIIGSDVLEALQDADEEKYKFTEHEMTVIGHLMYNIEYNGAYIFR